jgi:hypothetical protein
MSQENVETLRRLIDLWAEGPSDVSTDRVAPEIEFISPLIARDIAGARLVSRYHPRIVARTSGCHLTWGVVP